MQPLTFAAGSVVFAAGDASEAVYIIREGEVAITVGAGAHRTEVARLQAGELFGESGVLEARPRAATATTLTPTTLLVTPAAIFKHAFGMDNDAALTLVKLICGRLRNANLITSQADHAGERVAPQPAAPGALRLLADSDRMASLLPESPLDITCLPFQVGNRYGGETLPIASNRTCCIAALGEPELGAPHFEILRRAGRLGVRDLGSRFGTIVNGASIGRGMLDVFAPLKQGENSIIAGRPTSPFRFRIMA